MNVTTDGNPLLPAIRRWVEGANLDEATTYQVACAIMEGQATPSQIAAVLVALRMKGETVDEIAGFARAMRDRSVPLDVDSDTAVDTCGTGGDGLNTFNISTAVAFVASAAGVKVAKHGNRAVSSKCGSVEVLEALGVDADADPATAAENLELHGLAFLFAPRYHQATRHAVGPRREIGIRSVFNAVGPLTNPAGAKRQLMGVYDAALTHRLASVLGRLGARHCMVVHGDDGLDEISLSGPTRVSEWRDNELHDYSLTPEDVGLPRAPLDAIRGGSPEHNAAILESIASGASGPPRDITVLNAGAVIFVAGVAPTLAAGVSAAQEAIDSGAVTAKLAALRNARQQRAGGGHG